VITWASRGIGAALARRFAREGRVSFLASDVAAYAITVDGG
jgi:NAD(P)-dependent dehydrogenase (short-subunit alcohol dehydrogenase family)